ncbi:hypothetical protein RJ639_046650 [Escallonia herrerae]|uniref:TF-B3 domain-containing protein n=1 Tax=Escallonia herrerae TaxID=1293975 RepID=A0AA89B0M6_9ASTE|nr:hypothetical protein RJ639_046650 [Escallonia herrerae]
MADDGDNNTYEEARKRRLLDNKKRFEDLGILKISKSLSDLRGTEKKSQQRSIKPKSRSLNALEPRRSSRARNTVPSYRDDVEIDLAPFRLRKKSKFDSSWARLSSLSFCINVTPINVHCHSTILLDLTAILQGHWKKLKMLHMRKEYVQLSARKSSKAICNPNIHLLSNQWFGLMSIAVFGCWFLIYFSFSCDIKGLPTAFCEDHLPKSTENMVLEDENGTEYDAVFISKRTGLSGGWRAFALDHKLDDGDALVFELTEPTRFKASSYQ